MIQTDLTDFWLFSAVLWPIFSKCLGCEICLENFARQISCQIKRPPLKNQSLDPNNHEKEKEMIVEISIEQQEYIGGPGNYHSVYNKVKLGQLLGIGEMLTARILRSTKDDQPIGHVLIYCVTDNLVFSF